MNSTNHYLPAIQIVENNFNNSMKNKWKIAFWICFSVLLIVIAGAIYVIIDQGISLSYLRVSYSRSKSDLDQLGRIITQTDLSKGDIQRFLLQDDVLYDSPSDTIELNEKMLIFEKSKLMKVADR